MHNIVAAAVKAHTTESVDFLRRLNDRLNALPREQVLVATMSRTARST